MTANSYRAVIFDMDGVLVDSEPAFFAAVNDLLAPTGKQVGWDQYQRFLGTSTSVTWRGVLDSTGLTDSDIEPYMEGFGDRVVYRLSEPRAPLPGVRELIDQLRHRSIPVGLATSSREEWAIALLGAAELPFELFDALVWRQMVDAGKPAPDLYLHAAELLDIEPARCIAVEDTPTGIAAAKAAGMYAVHVRDSSTAFPPIDEANLVIGSLTAFPITMLHGG